MKYRAIQKLLNIYVLQRRSPASMIGIEPTSTALAIAIVNLFSSSETDNSRMQTLVELCAS